MNLTTRKNNFTPVPRFVPSLVQYTFVPRLVQSLMHHLVHYTASKTYHSELLQSAQFLAHPVGNFIILTTLYYRSLYKFLKTTDISGLLSDYTVTFLHHIHQHSLTLAKRIHLNIYHNKQYDHSTPISIPLSLKEVMNGPDAFGPKLTMDNETKAVITVNKETSSRWVFNRQSSVDSICILIIRKRNHSDTNLILNFVNFVNHSIIIPILKQIISDYRSTFQSFTQLLQIQLYHTLHFQI